VDIAYAYSGADDLVIRSLVDAGVAGIVAAGLGSGGSPRAFMNGLMAAKEAGVKVVIATQTGNGRIIKNRRFSEQDYLVADNLTPKKARILLMLGLSVTDDPDELQRMMWTY
jgi:L-asparaginase